MSMQDPIADMLTRIRNAQMANLIDVEMQSSKVKLAIAELLKKEGYIERVDQFDSNGFTQLRLTLRYYNGKPVIHELKRVSRPSLRRYSQAKDIPSVRNGYGIAIVSTVQGLLTDREARTANVGGEILATVF